jgi:diguanylate cyclase (GGDEF)-like protein
MGTQRRTEIGAVAYFLARLVVVVALAWAWAADELLMPLHAQAVFFGAGMLVVTTVGLVLAPLVARRTMSLPTAMLAALPFDLAGLAAWVVAFGSYLDPLYAIFVAVGVVYALVLPRRHSIIATVSSVAVYAFALAAAGFVYPSLRPPAQELNGALFFLGVKLVVMLGVGLYISAVIDAKRKRRLEAVEAERELAEANRNLALRVEQLQAVSRITEIVHKNLDIESVAEEVAGVVAHTIGVSECVVLILEKATGTRVFSARTAGAGDDALMSCVPVHDHRDLQVIFCAPGAEAVLLESDDVLILEAIASQLVIAVENSRLYKLTHHLSVTDGLTGLYNFRYLQQRLEQELERARRYAHDVSLLIIDTDQFKDFNDRFGHPAGDVALADLATVLCGAVRDVDVVCRYGGEEFAIVLPETDVRGAYVAAENVRDAVREHRFCDDRDSSECQLTVSVGFATYPQHAADCDELLREADDALYRAKHEGRDRVRAPLAKGSQSAPVAVAGTEE